MNEQNVDAPEQVRKFAPKRNPRSNRHPTDQAGEALIDMLHEAARASDENTGRVMEFVHELTATSSTFAHGRPGPRSGWSAFSRKSSTL